jgi:hypothetical protein
LTSVRRGPWTASRGPRLRRRLRPSKRDDRERLGASAVDERIAGGGPCRRAAAEYVAGRLLRAAMEGRIVWNGSELYAFLSRVTASWGRGRTRSGRSLRGRDGLRLLRRDRCSAAQSASANGPEAIGDCCVAVFRDQLVLPITMMATAARAHRTSWRDERVQPSMPSARGGTP